MRYPKYSDCRPSGVEWLGEIPSHWDVRRLRFVARTNPLKSELTGYEDDDLVSFVPMEAVGEYGGLTLGKNREISTVSEGYTYFADGDVVLAKITPCFENGKGAVAKELTNGIAFGTTELHVVRPEVEYSNRFLFYLTISDAFRKIGASEMYGAGGQKRVPEEFIKDFRTGYPDFAEQEQIASFLDLKTQQLDKLIEKKQQLINQLNEKRIALITQAVTQGLDESVQLKPSGVDWLGMIPNHWDVMPIKFSLSDPITDGPHETPELVNAGVPFLSAEAVKNDRLDFSKKRGFITEEEHLRFSKKYCPQRGDIYMVKSGATTGNVARVETDEVFNIWSPLAALRPDPTVSTTDFMFYFMKSKCFFHSVELNWSYGTQQNIGMGVIANLKIALPSLEEQQAICAYLEKELSKIELAFRTIHKAIQQLREYRTALITAAVTGKIDVRNVELKEVA